MTATTDPRRQRPALIAGIVALLSLLLTIRISPHSDWLRVCLDASHGPIFAGVAILLALLMRPGVATASAWPHWRRSAWVLVICIALGVLIEYLQGFEGRPPSFFDVMTDTAGATAGLAVWALARRPRSEWSGDGGVFEAALVVVLGLFAVAFILWRPLNSAMAYAHRTASFPVIAQFEGPIDLHFATMEGVAAQIGELPAPWSHLTGERALELRYDASHPPAIQIVEPSGDWRGYEVIAVDLTNTGPNPVPLVFRILDQRHDWSHADRFNLPLEVPPRTRTTVRVTLDAVESAPATRRMDMGRIANVMIFGRPPTASGSLWISRIWLE